MSYPLYSPESLLPALRDYLVAQGFVRSPTTPNSYQPTDLPPLWLDPKKGVPYPGATLGPNESHPTMVLGAYPATGIPSQPFEGFLVQSGVTLWYRSTKSPLIMALHERIRGVLHDRRDLNMNGLLVNEAILVRELQRIGSGEEGFTYSCEYKFQLWNSNYVFTP